ncbi:MAG: NHL repeat-containing protein [Armatimonadota bacterium]
MKKWSIILVTAFFISTVCSGIFLLSRSNNLVAAESDQITLSSERIYINPGNIAIRSGVKHRFSVYHVDSKINETPVAGEVQWSIDPDSGSISSDGIFTAGSKPGIYPNAVKAMVGNLSAYAIVEIRAPGKHGSFTFERAWGGRAPENLGPGLPFGLAVDSESNVYISSTEHNRVLKYDREENYITSWGTYGKNPGQFDAPIRVAVNSQGTVYVQDTDRIQLFTPDGKYISRFAKELAHPRLIGIDGKDNIYIVDKSETRTEVHIFDTNEKTIQTWALQDGTKAGQIRLLYDIAVDPDGSLYFADAVMDGPDARIQKFDSNGRFIRIWNEKRSDSSDENEGPAIATDLQGNVYVGGPSDPNIRKYNPDGKLIDRFKSDLGYTWNIRTGPDGNIYVLNNCCLGVIEPENKSFKILTGIEFLYGRFSSPEDAAVNSKGDIYVLDASGWSIHKFNSMGKYQYIREIDPAKGKDYPSLYELALDKSGNLYVSDLEGDRILKLDPSGKLLMQWPSKVARMTIAPDNTLLTTQAREPVVSRYSPSGKLIKQIRFSPKSYTEYSESFSGIAADKAGDFYVIDNDPLSVKKFSPTGKRISSFRVYPKDTVFEDHVSDIAIGPGGEIFLSMGSKIREYNSKGRFITEWSWKSTDVGDVGKISIDSKGNLYIADLHGQDILIFNRK